jgi:biotin carboxyl carrier protein
MTRFPSPRLVALLNELGHHDFRQAVIESADWRLVIERLPGLPPPPTVMPPVLVVAPVAGTFESALAVGASVAEGQTLAIIRVLDNENAIASPRRGRVVEICAQEGDLVGYAQPLFRLAPETA